ncbi:RcpC/CpaB family pilus assembly protein [Phenylobacterium aquaticum]|uniref:RcpC/CpaB family pilus assembly protein n=1 Tax=Phenylobacterium aquaticum TaxID=1763816 RepID=UPI001F5D85E1|nr:RcpC/CpaB family pilus assembly protein [Phenylobacterium aquaticum]MCI3132710.1 RcpC/CpaB family pilus assembly protein [Phenylobacterium aquaticum]
MAGTDPFNIRSAPKSGPRGIIDTLKNIGFFAVALIATVAMVTLFKAATASATTDHGGGRYFLEATQTLKVGDVLSPENAVWRSGVGKNTHAYLTDDTKSSDRYWGWRVLAPIRAGKPVTNTSVVEVNQAANVVSLPPGMVGFVLSGDELASTTELLRPGSDVNVIAVAGGTRKLASMTPSVATLVESAKVLYVRPGLKRGGRGVDATVTIAVAPDVAEDLAAWRQNGSLVLTLAGSTPPGVSRVGEWRELLEDETSDDTADEATDDTEAAPAAAPVQIAGEYKQRGVTIITPTGSAKQDIAAGVTQKVAQ